MVIRVPTPPTPPVFYRAIQMNHYHSRRSQLKHARLPVIFCSVPGSGEKHYMACAGHSVISLYRHTTLTLLILATLILHASIAQSDAFSPVDTGIQAAYTTAVAADCCPGHTTGDATCSICTFTPNALRLNPFPMPATRSSFLQADRHALQRYNRPPYRPPIIN